MALLQRDAGVLRGQIAALTAGQEHPRTSGVRALGQLREQREDFGAGSFADAGSRGAKEEALREAQAMAASRYHRCESCRGFACDDCFNAREQSCKNCVDKARYGEQRQEQEKNRARQD